MTVHTFAVSGPITLQCRFGFGAVTISTAADLDQASVEVLARDPASDIESRCTVAMRGRTLVVAAPRPHGGLRELAARHDQRDALDLAITVPAGTTAKIGTFSATVTTRGRSGTLDISGGVMTVDLDEIDGDLRLRLGSGPVAVGFVGGSASVRTGAGEIQLGEVMRSLDVALGSGDVRVATTHGGLRVRAGSGSATVERAEGDVDLVSGDGDLAVGVPAGARARLDVLTGKGELRTEMPVGDSRPSGPTTHIRARTGRGNVLISRSPDADRLAG